MGNRRDGAADQKVCVLCGGDCAGQPRIKDPRGRYYHKTCHAEAARQREAGEAVTPMSDALSDALPAAGAGAGLGAMSGGLDDGPSFLDDILPPGAGLAGACPNCRSQLAPSAIVCTACGYNTQSGQAGTTRKLKAKKPRAAAGARGGGGGDGFFQSAIGVFLVMVFVGIAFSAVAIAGSGVGVVMAVVATIGVGLALFGATIWAVVDAFREGRIGWGVLNLLVSFASLIYIFVHDVDSRLRGLLPGALVAYLMLVGSLTFGVLLPAAIQAANDEENARIERAMRVAPVMVQGPEGGLVEMPRDEFDATMGGDGRQLTPEEAQRLMEELMGQGGR